MKITIYELLGMVKDGKAPKKIKFYGVEWEYTGYQYERIDKANLGNIWNGYNFNILNDEVEILEEKKIPEKILEDEFDELTKESKLWKLFYKYNDLINYLKSKSKGE